MSGTYVEFTYCALFPLSDNSTCKPLLSQSGNYNQWQECWESFLFSSLLPPHPPSFKVAVNANTLYLTYAVQGSTLTLVNWTMASGNHTLACKSLGIQAILAWRNSLKSDFTFEINWEWFAYVTWKTLQYQFLGLFKWKAFSHFESWLTNQC